MNDTLALTPVLPGQTRPDSRQAGTAAAGRQAPPPGRVGICHPCTLSPTFTRALGWVVTGTSLTGRQWQAEAGSSRLYRQAD